MTDVQIAFSMQEDARTQRPAGMILVSGDKDFVPAIKSALSLGIPVSVFNPTGKANFQLDVDTPHRDLFEIADLAQDLMAECPLGREKEWIDYLERKMDSYRNPKSSQTKPPYEAYKKLLDEEKRRVRNRIRVASR